MPTMTAAARSHARCGAAPRNGGTILPADLTIVIGRARDRSTYIRELDTNRANPKNIAQDIAAGQIDNALCVLQCPADGQRQDITEDIARAVLGIALDDNGAVPDHLVDFIEQHLGCEALARASREYAREAAREVR